MIQGVLVLVVVEKESSDIDRLPTGVERAEQLTDAELCAVENREAEDLQDQTHDEMLNLGTRFGNVDGRCGKFGKDIEDSTGLSR